MCQDDKKTDEAVIALRMRLCAEPEKILPHKSKTPDVAKLEKIFASIEDIYTPPASAVPRLAIWDLLHAMAVTYMFESQQPKVIESPEVSNFSELCNRRRERRTLSDQEMETDARQAR